MATQDELQRACDYATSMFQALNMEGRATLAPAPPGATEPSPGGGPSLPLDMGEVIDCLMGQGHFWVYAAATARKSLSDSAGSRELWEVYEVFDDRPSEEDGSPDTNDMGAYSRFAEEALNVVLDTVYRRARDAAHASLQPAPAQD